MKTFLKSYAKYAVWFLGAAALMYMWLSVDEWKAKYSAMSIAKNIQEKARIGEQKRAAYYSKEYARLKAVIAQKEMEIDLIAAGSRKYQADAKAARAEIATMKECEAARIALDFELGRCLTNVKQITDDFVLQIGELEVSFNNLIAKKDVEIGELVGEKTELVKKYSVAYSKYLKFRASRARRAAIYVGTGIVAGLILSRLVGR